MSQESAFQMLCKDIGNLAMYMVAHNGRLPRPDSVSFNEVLKETVIQYIAIMLQTSSDLKKTIYGHVSEYYPYTLDASLRKFYRHEKTVRTRLEGETSDKLHLYDPADFITIQNRVERRSPLTEAVLRKNIHLAKNLSDPTFAKIYAEYDQEYQAAAYLKNDSDYVFASIYFYRLEHAFALSTIANLADYMSHLSTVNLKKFSFKTAIPFVADITVPNIDNPRMQSFDAWPNLLSLQKRIPDIVVPEMLPDVISNDISSRVLKQNILERLPLSEQYGTFDMNEVATFIRTYTPIIEAHKPVSFYLDESTQTLNKPKIKIARKLMRQLYSFDDNPELQ